MPKIKVTLSDVARRAGVSPSTVSRVLNDREASIAISERTREKVRAAAAALDYRPNLAARMLVSGRSQAVAVLVHDISDPYFSEIVRGVEDVASAQQYMVLVSSTDRDPIRERDYILKMASFPTDGIILAAGGFEREPDPDAIQSLVASGTAIVGIARHRLPIATIGIDNQEGARQMVEYLLGLGHRRIAFVAGPPHLTTANDRLAGYRAALCAAGLSADDVVPGDFDREAGVAAIPLLLGCKPPVTAIFAANDKMAIGCLAGLRNAGIAVPDAISVAGFGDIPAAQDTDPPLSTVAVSLRELGRRAMDLILRQLAAEPPQLGSVPTTLAVRRSTGPH